MSDEELRDELMTLLLAGHETTATSLAWAIERLVRHPEAMDRLVTEAQRGRHRVRRGGVQGDAAACDPCCRSSRGCSSRTSRSAARLLPEGVIVAPNIYLVQHREDVYPDPRRFRPERFLEGQGGTYSWIPFGGGIRRCIGASFALFEMRIVLQAIARSVAAARGAAAVRAGRAGGRSP